MTDQEQPRNPLHGVTLEQILNELVEYFGWPTMGERIRIRCFTTDPSVPSSLKFLRKTPWARAKVESMYQFMLRDKARTERSRSAEGSPSAERGRSAKWGRGAEWIRDTEGPGSETDEPGPSDD